VAQSRLRTWTLSRHLISLYCLANLVCTCALALNQIQGAPDDREATVAFSVILGIKVAVRMQVPIDISTFGSDNGLIFAGSRVV
jgi:hypothetical protein